MIRPDDSSLDPDQRRVVEARAHKLLDRAAAWNRFPTAVDDIVSAADLRVAPTSMFDVGRLLSFIRDKTADAASLVKSAVSKVLGLYDSDDHVIHVDDTVSESKQKFLKLHETGHHELPAHRKIFRFFQDCEKTLSPETADVFEREANNFARFALFQGDTFARLAADCAFELKTPMKLARRFGASIYAACREFARSNCRACVVYVLDPIEYVEGVGARAAVRRIESSTTFVEQFGQPALDEITLDDAMGSLLPIGRRMTAPRSLSIKDMNGISHECVAEAFDTKWNIVILLYPIAALTRTTIVLPRGFKPAQNGFSA